MGTDLLEGPAALIFRVETQYLPPRRHGIPFHRTIILLWKSQRLTSIIIIIVVLITTVTTTTTTPTHYMLYKCRVLKFRGRTTHFECVGPFLTHVCWYPDWVGSQSEMTWCWSDTLSLFIDTVISSDKLHDGQVSPIEYNYGITWKKSTYLIRHLTAGEKLLIEELWQTIHK